MDEKEIRFNENGEAITDEIDTQRLEKLQNPRKVNGTIRKYWRASLYTVLLLSLAGVILAIGMRSAAVLVASLLVILLGIILNYSTL